MEQFTFFYRTDSPFSFWYPTQFSEDNVTFSSAQQYLLYHKALLFEDLPTAGKILSAHEKKDLMQLARTVANFKPDIWKAHRRQIATKANHLKFSQNEELKAALMATAGTILANANLHDVIWGIGCEEDSPQASDQSQWRGRNLLGTILMEIRDKELS